MQEFINQLKGEEKFFSDKYWESIRYNVQTKRNPSSKRKASRISKDKSASQTQLEDKIFPSYQKTKMNNQGVPSTSSAQQKIPLILTNEPQTKNVSIPWIVWKNYSCRVDVFATIAYHIFYYDFAEDIFPPIEGPKLPDEVHPLGVLLKDMNGASNLTIFQKSIDKYVNYRSRYLKEKAGEGGVLTVLFMQLKGLLQFTWRFKINFTCEACTMSSVKNYDSAPLFTISLATLQNDNGITSDVIKSSLRHYLGQCPLDYQYTIVKKEIIDIPNYYCCVLEYAEDIQLDYTKINPLSEISIEEQFEFENITFSLAGIIYFQGMHYTCHVKGISHPKFLPLRNTHWFYHDGIKSSSNYNKYFKGLLFENEPKFQYNILRDELKPYILIYRVKKN